MRVHLLMVKAKLHRARVTQCDLDYVGSISIDRTILQAAAILPYELVQITSYANATLWRTYVIPADADSGMIGLNGPPARLFRPGDDITVLSLALVSQRDALRLRPHVVFLSHESGRPNQIAEVRIDRVLEGAEPVYGPPPV
jgi:aspartate 1-decarboxylase